MKIWPQQQPSCGFPAACANCALTSLTSVSPFADRTRYPALRQAIMRGSGRIRPPMHDRLYIDIAGLTSIEHGRQMCTLR